MVIADAAVGSDFYSYLIRVSHHLAFLAIVGGLAVERGLNNCEAICTYSNRFRHSFGRENHGFSRLCKKKVDFVRITTRLRHTSRDRTQSYRVNITLSEDVDSRFSTILDAANEDVSG